ncbi:MAG: glycosyltransferase [Sedimentisphaerales bacterium]|nr:glycosyltransferase [Sedimentisphaerales bacterium]
MKLLILVNNPKRASFRLRAIDFLDYFRREGFVCEVCKLPQNNFQRWKLFKSARNYDAVLLHRKCLNYFDAQVLARNSRKIIFDHDDAIMYSPSRPESDHTSHFRLYKRTIQMSNCVIAGNDYLAEHARKFCSDVHIVPTGLDTKAFVKEGEQEKHDKIRLVWIGSESTLPYLEELRPVLEQVGKANDDMVLRIIADRFFDVPSMPVEKYNWSVETQAADLSAGDVGLAPLPDNRFTRGKCGFKILQYFASGLPVIASAVGVNEKFIAESQAGILASTPGQWIEAIEKLAADAALRKQMGLKGKQYVQDYDVSVIAEKFCKIVKGTISK